MTKILCSLLILLASAWPAFAQGGQRTAIQGAILDASSGQPLSYTTVQLLRKEDDGLAGGGISNDDGRFAITAAYGEYYAVLDFMGYTQFKTESFTVSRDHPIHDLGVIRLEPIVNELDEIVVQAEKSTMELALDKRIFNVGKDLGNAGGSASEILNNIPSVTVDAEGTVRLRGSSNVRILVDGKPSGLVSFKGGAGLQQLQASLIEKVEIITNPSARYEAEGMSGIINIVLKKDRKQGFNGSFEMTAGSPTNIGGAANVNYRRNNLNFFINYGISYSGPVERKGHAHLQRIRYFQYPAHPVRPGRPEFLRRNDVTTYPPAGQSDAELPAQSGLRIEPALQRGNSMILFRILVLSFSLS